MDASQIVSVINNNTVLNTYYFDIDMSRRDEILTNLLRYCGDNNFNMTIMCAKNQNDEQLECGLRNIMRVELVRVENDEVENDELRKSDENLFKWFVGLGLVISAIYYLGFQ